jgi:protein-disulfide isomerase
MQDHNEKEPPQPQDQQHQPEAEPPPEEASRAGGRRLAHKRIWALAVLVVAAAIAVVLTTTSSGSPQARQASDAPGVTPAQQVDALLAGIPQAGNVLGSPTAPVTLQFFGDLECPTSRAFTLVDLPSLISRWVRDRQLRIEYRSLETATHQPGVFLAQQAAALAAGAQDKGWYYIELFYHEQGHEDTGYATSTYLDRLAAQVPGLNVALWSKDREEPPLAAHVAGDEQTAARLGLHNTPALLVGRTDANDAHTTPRFFLHEPAPLYAAIEGVLGAPARSHTSATSTSATDGQRSFADWTGGPSAAHDTGSAPC